MTHPNLASVDCAECGGPLNEGSRFDRNAPAGDRVYRATPAGSTVPCACLIHAHCLGEIQANGSVNATCPCGAGQIGGGIPIEVGTATTSDPAAQPGSDEEEESEEDDSDEEDSDDDSEDDSEDVSDDDH